MGRKKPDSVASSLTPLPPLPTELFLNSMSQPFSLEEQEQILSCLSVDSLSLSDDSEKVSYLSGPSLPWHGVGDAGWGTGCVQVVGKGRSPHQAWGNMASQNDHVS